VAGISLFGTEIKSIRNNKANISDAYCIFIENELFVRNLHVSEYPNGGYSNHKPKRDRKLLLNKQEINKILGKSKEKGNSIVPIRLFINQSGKAKLEIALAKGKKIYDKRESIKAKDQKRDLERSNNKD
jgi:SsrA-binding protein